MNKTLKGHSLALLCSIIWGTSLIASKELLGVLSPVQLMFLRFAVAYIVIWIIHPKWYFKWKDELLFLLAALFSNTLYFIAESNALKLTQATNVGILVAAAPILTALILRITGQCGKFPLKRSFGYGLAFLGVICVVLNGALVLKLNPLGDMLAIAAALMWSIYSMIINRFKDVSSFLLSRKLMFYGLLTSFPLLLAEGGFPPLSTVVSFPELLYLLYLGVVCSAVCYIAWNTAIQCLGVLKTNVYIYIVPFFTLIASSMFLHETITPMGLAGMAAVIAGMLLSNTE